MIKNPSLLEWLLLFALVLIWGASFVAVKIAIVDISPLWLAAFRLIIGVILMAIFARFTNIRAPRGRYEWSISLILGIVGTALPFALIAWASLFVPSGIAGLMMATNPMLVLILAIVLLPDERPTLLRLVGLLTGFAGVALVIMGRGESTAILTSDIGADFSLLAMFALLLSALGYAINNVASRRATTIPHATRGYGALLTAAPAATLLAVIFEPFPNTFSIQSLGSTLYLAILPTWLATLILYRLIATTSAGFVAQSNYLVPATAIGLGAVILGEKLGFLQYMGFAIILFGVGLTENLFKLSRRKKEV